MFHHYLVNTWHHQDQHHHHQDVTHIWHQAKEECNVAIQTNQFLQGVSLAIRRALIWPFDIVSHFLLDFPSCILLQTKVIIVSFIACCALLKWFSQTGWNIFFWLLVKNLKCLIFHPWYNFTFSFIIERQMSGRQVSQNIEWQMSQTTV